MAFAGITPWNWGKYAEAAKLDRLRDAIRNAAVVVLDARLGEGPMPNEVSAPLHLNLPKVVSLLTDQRVVQGTTRRRVHRGYVPRLGFSSGGYYSAFETRVPEIIEGQASKPLELIVLIDKSSSGMLPVLGGLQQVGAKLVAVGSVPSWKRSEHLTLTEGVEAMVRDSEFIHPNGRTGLLPDAQITPVDDVVELLRRATQAAAEAEPAPTVATEPCHLKPQIDEPYGDMSHPPVEHRILAAFRIYNVMRYFFAYTHLMDGMRSSGRHLPDRALPKRPPATDGQEPQKAPQLGVAIARAEVERCTWPAAPAVSDRSHAPTEATGDPATGCDRAPNCRRQFG